MISGEAGLLPLLFLRKMRTLRWYGDEAGRLGFPDCPDCFDYMNVDGFLGACASVGIEHDLDTTEVARKVVEYFHETGHRSAVAA